MDSIKHLSMESLLQHDIWLRQLAARLASDAVESEELVQETWLAALRSPPEDRGHDPRGWLRRVLENVRAQFRRGDSRRFEREQTVAAERGLSVDPEELELHLEVRRQILDEVGALGGPYREVLFLRYYEGLSLRQVAQRRSAPLDTVRSQHTRALSILRQRLDQRAGGRGHWLSAFAPILQLSRTTKGVLGLTTATKTGLALGVLTVLATTLWWKTGESRGEPLASLSRKATVTNELEALAMDHGSTTRVAVEDTSTLEPPADSASAPDAARTVEGYVLDVDGNPVPGAIVSSKVEVESPKVTADDEGRFEWPVGEEIECLIPSRSGMTPVLETWIRPDQTWAALLVLAPELEVSGWVVDAEDRPLSGAYVGLSLKETWAHHLPVSASGGTRIKLGCVTDEEGAFRFDALPRIKQASLQVLYSDDENPSAGQIVSSFPLPLTSRNDLRLVLREEVWEPHLPDAPRMLGRLVDHKGNPVARARVVAGGSPRFLTAGDGSFSVPHSYLKPNTMLRAIKRGLLPLSASNPNGPDQDWPNSIELQLGSEPLSKIRGTVTNPQGAPLEGCQVWIKDPTAIREGPSAMESLTSLSFLGSQDSQESWAGKRTFQTDGAGSFELTALPNRQYRIAVLNPKTRAHLERTAMAGEHSLQLVLPEEPELVSLEGRCVAPDGTALAKIEVEPLWIAPLDNGYQCLGDFITITDEAGRFSFSAIPKGFNGVSCEGRSIVKVVTDAQFPDIQPLEIVLQRRADLQVRTSRSSASHFMLRRSDGAAERLIRYSWIIDGTVEGSSLTAKGPFAEGRSTTYTVVEGDYTIELYVGQELVSTQPVRAKAGERTEAIVD